MKTVERLQGVLLKYRPVFFETKELDYRSGEGFAFRILVCSLHEPYAGGILAAICAAPGTVLSQLDDLQGVAFTCYDGFAAPLEAKGAHFTAKPAVTSGRIITGRGPGHTKAFALEIVKKVKGDAVAAAVQQGMDLTYE